MLKKFYEMYRTISIPKELYDKVRTAAHNDKRSIRNYIIAAIEKKLEVS